MASKLERITRIRMTEREDTQAENQTDRHMELSGKIFLVSKKELPDVRL